MRKPNEIWIFSPLAAGSYFHLHQALVCTHMDGHNGSGNIHVHIVINSLRKLDVPQQPFMERPIDCKDISLLFLVSCNSQKWEEKKQLSTIPVSNNINKEKL